MSGLKALWLARTPRERWLLGAMFALVALVLVWFLVLRPLGDMLSAAKARHGNAVAELAEAVAAPRPRRRRAGRPGRDGRDGQEQRRHQGGQEEGPGSHAPILGDRAGLAHQQMQ